MRKSLFSHISGTFLVCAIALTITGGLLTSNVAFATAGGGASSNIKLLDNNANGIIETITFDITNATPDTWTLNGAAPYGLSATQGGNALTISNVTILNPSANPVTVQVTLNEGSMMTDTDGVGGANPIELIYTPAGIGSSPSIQDSDDELNAILTGDTGVTDTEVDWAAPFLDIFEYQDANSDGAIDQIEVFYSENVVAASFLSANDLLFTNVGDFTGAAFGGLGTDLITGTVGSTIVPLGTASLVVDTSEDSGTIAISTQNAFSVQDANGNINNTLGAQPNAMFNDLAAPVAIGMAYVDSNTDGTIDGAGINFSENVTYTYQAADWTATANGLTGFNITGCSSCTNTNQLQFTATANADITGVNAGTEPTLAYVAGNLIVDQSPNGNTAPNFGMSLGDLASPVLIDLGYYGNAINNQVDTIEAEFSENITLATYADADWTIAPGSIGLANETGVSVQGGNGTSAFLDIASLGTLNVTGGATAPTLTYTDAGLSSFNDGKGNDVASFGAVNVDDWADPFLLSFTSTTADATYGPTNTINVTANYTENIASGAIVLTLDTTGITTLSTHSAKTVSGTYTVGNTGSGENSTDLTVSSITSDTATDGNGNTITTTTVPSTNIADGSDIVVDTTADAAPGTPNLQTASDSGASSSDDYTNDNTPTFDISCVTGSTVTLRINTADDNTGLCAGGTVSITANAIADASVNVDAYQTDPAGNKSSDSADLGVTIDTIAPTPTPANISITGCNGLAGECIINDTVIMTWNAGADGWTDVVSVTPLDMSQFGGAAGQNAVDDGSQCGDVVGDNIWTGCYNITGMEGIDATNRNVVVTATDGAGNVSAPVTGTNNMSVDTIAPTISNNGTLTITTDLGSPFGVVGVAAVNDSIVPDQVTQSGATVTIPDGDTITIDLTALTGQAAVPDGTQSGVVIPGTLENAAATFTITATDNAGNTATALSDAIDVDNIMPNLGLSGLTIITNYGVPTTAAVNGGTTLPDQVNVNAAVGTPDGDTITWDASPIGGPISVANNTPATVVAGTTDSLTQTFNIKAVDDAGNVTINDSNSIDGTTIRVDNILPILATSGLTISTDNGVGGVAAVNGGGIAPDMVTVTATVTVPDGDTITWDASSIGGGATASNGAGTSLSAGTIDNATQAFNITVTDNGGNVVTSDSNSIDGTTISVDNLVPTIGTAGSLAITLDNNSNSEANVNDTVTYNDGLPGAADGDAWTVDLTGLTGNAAATNAGSPYTVIIGALNGATTFTESVTDNAGNVITGQTSGLAVDNRSPLNNTSIALSNAQTGASTTFTVAFDTTATWPADGKFELIFPAEFNVAGLNGNNATALTNVDGVITAAVTGQTVVLTRDNSGTPVAGGTSVSFDIATGTNGGSAGTTGQFSFKTLDAADALIDIDDNVAGVTLTAPPATPSTGGGGGGGGGRRTPSATTETATTGEPLVFSDVVDHWAETYINDAKDGGYVEGYEDKTFKPDQYITRAEAAKLVAMWLDANIGEEACNADLFSDIDCADWYAKYVTYLSDAGVIEGYGDGIFGPANNINRAEALKMMLIAKALQDSNIADIINPFSDVSTDQWFYNYVMVGYKLSIVQGYEDGTFGPAKNVTRAEFTKIFVETLINN